jgi:hypothetical protein
MAVTLTGSGGLFTRLGYWFGLAKTRRTAVIASYPTAATSTAGIRTVYSAIGANAGNFPLAHRTMGAAGSEDTMADFSLSEFRAIQSAASRLLIDTMDADTPLPERTEQEAIRELAKQMVTASASINATTYTVGSPSYGSVNVGTFSAFVDTEAPKIIKDSVTFTNKLTDWPAIRPETLNFVCEKDSRNGGVRPGSEVFRVRGDRAWPNLDRRWRGGSGTNMTITATSAAIDSDQTPGQNILANSNFEIFASNTPVFRGSSAISFVGDGATLTKIRQLTNDSTGTTVRLKPDTLYLIAFAVRDDGTAPAAGVLRVAFEDNSGSVIGSMSQSVTLSTVGSAYAVQSLMVISPINIPDTVYCTIALTTALTNTRAVYVDELVVTEMPRTAKGGPGICIYPGTTDARYGDIASVAISYANQGEFNLEFDRFFDLYNRGLALPSNDAGAETISDSLIT